MEILLIKDIEKLGKAGTCVKVKDGYGRNYLIPKKFACLTSEANMKKFQAETNKVRLEQEKKLDSLLKLRDRLKGSSCTVVARAIDDKKLYGSIDKYNIKSALESEGIELDEKNIILEEPIRELGVYAVTIRLHPEIEAEIKVWVVKK